MHTTYWCEMAWLPAGEVAESVVIEVEGRRITDVRPGAPAPPEAVRLAGLTLPGFADCHSHVFQRALRGRTQNERGGFWGWRERMYHLAAALDPDTLPALATAAFAEMALAGITCVGEFHYLHHGPGGVPYADPNEMGHAVIRAAKEAGLRITLLDTCYLTGGVGAPLTGTQVRFSDRTVDRWAARAEDLAARYAGDEEVEIGAAIHSVRAVPPEQMPVVVEFAHRNHAPLHMHVSEQRAENEACVDAYSATPVQVLHEHGALGPRSTAVHAIHVSDVDIALLGGSSTHVCACRTTERDLADGVGPLRELFLAGSPLTLGTDSNAVVDMFEEARAVELDERLTTGERARWTAAELLTAATAAGHASLGFPDAGCLTPGAWADLVAIRLDSARTAGAAGPWAAETAVFSATAADVHTVISGGRRIVEDGRHVLGDVGRLLREALARLG